MFRPIVYCIAKKPAYLSSKKVTDPPKAIRAASPLDRMDFLLTHSFHGLGKETSLIEHQGLLESHVHVRDSLRHGLRLASVFGLLPVARRVHLSDAVYSSSGPEHRLR